MAGLQRFITYIYRYENDEKKENAGFAKVEIRGSVCRMEVHIRNINMEQPEAAVYLFTRKADIIQGILVGNIAVSRGNGDVRYTFETKELLDFGVTIGDMEGIFIPFGENVYLASQWKEGAIAQKRFRMMEKREESSAAEDNEESKAAAGAEESAGPEAVEQKHQQNTQPKRNIQATELPLEAFFEENGWEGIFQKLRLKLNVFFPFEGQEIECVRMQLNDLQELPKKYWHIGNNSFLLHGFFNYRHIILGEMTEGGKKEYFIGVPGVFANQERIMATMFGFPEFRTAKNAEYKTGNFGYWYRVI